MPNVGEYIKKLRVEKGLTQEELGNMIGVKRAAVNKWESGLVQNLKRTTIQRLADIFDVNPSSFIDGYEPDLLIASDNLKQLVLTTDEEKLVIAYRAHPEHQSTIKKILDIDSNTIELHLAASDGATATIKVDNADELRKDTEALRRKNGLL